MSQKYRNLEMGIMRSLPMQALELKHQMLDNSFRTNFKSEFPPQHVLGADADQRLDLHPIHGIPCQDLQGLSLHIMSDHPVTPEVDEAAFGAILLGSARGLESTYKQAESTSPFRALEPG